MECPYCQSRTSVENSRLQKRSNQVWRRRACKACRAVFTTHEAIDLSTTLLVQNKADMEPFSAERLYADILVCMPRRPDRYIAAKEAAFTVVVQLLTQQSSATVTPQQIVQSTSKVLKALDSKAYLHYTANHL